MRARAPLILLGCLAAGVAGGCGSSGDDASGSPTAKAPVRILWVGDTTGPLKAYGDVQLAGVRGAADFFNARGGMDGRKVEVKAVSDNGDPTTAATVLTRELASATPTMVWPGSASSDSAAMIPVLAKRKVFAIGLVDGQAQCRQDAQARCPHFWSLANPTSVAQQGVVDAIKAKGLTRVGVLEETTPFSSAETPYLRAAAKRSGLQVDVASFPPSTADLAPQLQQLRRHGAQVVYAEGIGTAQYALGARADAAWDVPVIFDTSASAIDITKLAKPGELQDAHVDMLRAQDARQPVAGLAPMVRAASRHAKVTALPLTVAATGWDAVVTLDAAIAKAGGSLAVEDLDAAMLALPPTDPLRTLTQRLGWTRDNHENVLGTPGDYSIAAVGPLVGGRVQGP